MPDDYYGECDRCGAEGPRKRKLMFYGAQVFHPESHTRLEFYCADCLRQMKRFAVIGFSVLGLLVLLLAGLAIWAIYV